MSVKGSFIYYAIIHKTTFKSFLPPILLIYIIVFYAKKLEPL